MLLDTVKQAFAYEVVSSSTHILETDNDVLFTFVYANQHVMISIRHVIDNGSILFTKLNEVYSDDVLQIIPYVLVTYFCEKYSGYNFFIFYSDNELVFNSYSRLFSYMPPISYQYNFDTFKTSKYMYRYIYNNGCMRTPVSDFIKYMDDTL